MTSTISIQNPEALLAQLTELQTNEKQLRIRDIANRLKVSEAELLACQIPQGKVQRIQGDWATFITKLPELGKIMALTRNEACVIEHKGRVESVEVVHGNIGLIIGEIELRLFLNAWKVGFAVESISRGQTLKSFQIFDAHGTASIKFFLQPESDNEAYERLFNDFLSTDQSPTQEVKPLKPTELQAIDAEALLIDWRNMKDTHDFHMILRKHKADRFQAIESVNGVFSEIINNKEAILKVLEFAASEQLPIMVFVSNPGSVQIHQSTIQNVKVLDQWYNVLDENFNLHLNTDEISNVRLVRKPTEDGVVTSIEAFDLQNELSVQIFGLRKPGIRENLKWRELAESLVK